jgi:hypothetical protein
LVLGKAVHGRDTQEAVSIAGDHLAPHLHSEHLCRDSSSSQSSGTTRPSVAMEAVDIGGWSVAVEPTLLALASQRCCIQPFRRPPSSQGPSFTIRRVERLPESAQRVSLPEPGLGEYALREDALLARIREDPFAAEAALRVAFHAVTLRQGGILVHASGIAFGAECVVAVGASGAGKTTLARQCRTASARSMSDEIIALYPGDIACGTPFRSDQTIIVDAIKARAIALLALKHANSELLEPISGPDVASLVVSQAYRFAQGELSPSALLQRVAAIVESMDAYRLSFRADPAVGPFLRQWMSRREQRTERAGTAVA